MYYIGNFQHLTDQQATNETGRRHGDFAMMVQAGSAEEALALFRQRLAQFRKSTDFFDGQSVIYITHLLEFDQFPTNEAVLLNFKSYAGDPKMPFIACAVPTEQSNACHIHEWQSNRPTTEGQTDSLFMEFNERSSTEG